MPLMYRVQLPPHADWTEWREIDEPLNAPLILSLQLSETPSWEQWAEIAKKLGLKYPSKEFYNAASSANSAYAADR